MIFLHLFDTSQAPAGLAPSLLGRNAGGYGIEFSHLDVGQDFAVEFPIEGPFAE